MSNTKWINGQEANGKTLVLELPMHLETKTTKKGTVFNQLANIGSQFGGVQIGTDANGNRIMAKISIYKKVPASAETSTNTSFKIA